MGLTAILALVGLIYQSDTIGKDTYKGTKAIIRIVKRPKHTVAHPIAAVKQAVK